MWKPAVKMIGSPLQISPDTERETQLERHRGYRQQLEAHDTLDGPEHVIVGERQEGKTYLAIRWLQDTPRGCRRVLVTLDRNLADEINGRLGIPYGEARAISFRQLLNNGPEQGAEYGFDELDKILAHVFKIPGGMLRLLTICTAAPWQGTHEWADEDDA